MNNKVKIYFPWKVHFNLKKKRENTGSRFWTVPRSAKAKKTFFILILYKFQQAFAKNILKRVSPYLSWTTVNFFGFQLDFFFVKFTPACAPVDSHLIVSNWIAAPQIALNFLSSTFAWNKLTAHYHKNRTRPTSISIARSRVIRLEWLAFGTQMYPGWLYLKCLSLRQIWATPTSEMLIVNNWWLKWKCRIC